MGEKSKNGLSVSFRIDSGIVEHNNRHFIAKNVDRERIADNITYKSENLREFYLELFGQALTEYNAKQKRQNYYRLLRTHQKKQAGKTVQ